MIKKKRVVIIISGSGSNMQALARAAQNPDFPAEIVGVISDNPNAGGLQKACALSLPTHVIARQDFTTKANFEDAMLEVLAAYQTDIICLAGFMRLLSARFIAPYEGRILNIHPSLLPLFPGLNTHERALHAGVKISGCTVHLVTEGMDEGRILAQGAVPVNEGDTVDTLANRVLAVEHIIYSRALKALIEQRSPDYRRDSSLISI